MQITDAPPRTELVRRAAEIVPVLREHAVWSEENRRLHPESIQAVTDAGLLRMRVPTRYGGHESDMRTVVDVIAELARGDGSVAWTVAVWAISSWMAGLFPDEVQDGVFADPDVRISGILSPTAMATPTDGGVIINGKWAFNTGVTQSTWNTNAAVLATPDGGFQPVMLLIENDKLNVVDDWHTSGLRGSGSVTTLAQDLFLPDHQVLPMGPVLGGQHLSVINASSPRYQVPFMATACTTVSAVALGLAKAAKEAFFERLPDRKITYTDYDSQAKAPITHLQVSEAGLKVDEAEFHTHRAAALVDTKSEAGESWTIEERARIRLALGATTLRAKEAVDIYNTASGGSSIYQSVPIQRIERDVQTVNLHAVMHPNTNFELYGRILCGLEPNTVYI
jgi:alkylation response protein AidB-like acyl-CoA dehydrogenase